MLFVIVRTACCASVHGIGVMPYNALKDEICPALFWRVFTRGRGGFQRLDMDEDIADGGHGRADFVLHVVRDFVRATDGHLRVYFDVHFDEEKMAGFARETFFDGCDTVGASGDLADLADDIGIGGAVHEFAQRGTQ